MAPLIFFFFFKYNYKTIYLGTNFSNFVQKNYHHSCERRVYAFMILQEYTIISLLSLSLVVHLILVPHMLDLDPWNLYYLHVNALYSRGIVSFFNVFKLCLALSHGRSHSWTRGWGNGPLNFFFFKYNYKTIYLGTNFSNFVQ